MENTSQMGEPPVSYLVHVPQEKLEEFADAVRSTGVNFHPVESQVHIDFDSDLNTPNMKSGQDLAGHVRHINRFLEQREWSPLMTQPGESTDPATAAEILKMVNLWFEWSGITVMKFQPEDTRKEDTELIEHRPQVVGFHGGHTPEQWTKFAGCRPRLFNPAGQEADEAP